jgi:hypothetical protein
MQIKDLSSPGPTTLNLINTTIIDSHLSFEKKIELRETRDTLFESIKSSKNLQQDIMRIGSIEDALNIQPNERYTYTKDKSFNFLGITVKAEKGFYALKNESDIKQAQINVIAKQTNTTPEEILSKRLDVAKRKIRILKNYYNDPNFSFTMPTAELLTIVKTLQNLNAYEQKLESITSDSNIESIVNSISESEELYSQISRLPVIADYLKKQDIRFTPITPPADGTIPPADGTTPPADGTGINKHITQPKSTVPTAPVVPIDIPLTKEMAETIIKDAYSKIGLEPSPEKLKEFTDMALNRDAKPGKLDEGKLSNDIMKTVREGKRTKIDEAKEALGVEKITPDNFKQIYGGVKEAVKTGKDVLPTIRGQQKENQVERYGFTEDEYQKLLDKGMKDNEIGAYSFHIKKRNEIDTNKPTTEPIKLSDGRYQMGLQIFDTLKEASVAKKETDTAKNVKSLHDQRMDLGTKQNLEGLKTSNPDEFNRLIKLRQEQGLPTYNLETSTPEEKAVQDKTSLQLKENEIDKKNLSGDYINPITGTQDINLIPFAQDAQAEKQLAKTPEEKTKAIDEYNVNKLGISEEEKRIKKEQDKQTILNP